MYRWVTPSLDADSCVHIGMITTNTTTNTTTTTTTTTTIPGKEGEIEIIVWEVEEGKRQSMPKYRWVTPSSDADSCVHIGKTKKALRSCGKGCYDR